MSQNNDRTETGPTSEELRQQRQQELEKEKAAEADEARRRALQKKVDDASLEAAKARREELELQERLAREALEAEGGNREEDQQQRTSEIRKEKRSRTHRDGSPESESRSWRPRTGSYLPSDSENEEEDPQLIDRLQRVEKFIYGDQKKRSREPILTEEIDQYAPPPGRQFPKMTKFSGKGDPEDHCEEYESLMTGMGHCEIMLCKMFKIYLKGSASLWYRSLRPRSISSYDRLKGKFLRHYSHLCRREKDTESLIHCRQKPDEELGDYLARFKEEAGMVTNLDKVKAAGFLTAGLDSVKGRKLRSSLYDIPPKSLNDIYIRGENIRRKMESIDGYKESPKEDRKGGSQGRNDRKKDNSRKSDKHDNDGRDSRKKERERMVFTPLNTPISKILHEIKGRSDFRRPAKLRVPDHKKNGDKYCDYHQDRGHNTDECFHLKKLIEKMVKSGDLNQFVKDLRDRLEPKRVNRDQTDEAEDRDREDEAPRRRNKDEVPRYRGEVKTITGVQFSIRIARPPERDMLNRSTIYINTPHKLNSRWQLCSPKRTTRMSSGHTKTPW